MFEIQSYWVRPPCRHIWFIFIVLIKQNLTLVSVRLNVRWLEGEGKLGVGLGVQGLRQTEMGVCWEVGVPRGCPE